jgi:hypothetical protein
MGVRSPFKQAAMATTGLNPLDPGCGSAAGLVDHGLGEAYEVVEAVYNNLSAILLLSALDFEGFALTTHNHDDVYQPKGNYSLDTHRHDALYAQLEHEHDDRYLRITDDLPEHFHNQYLEKTARNAANGVAGLDQGGRIFSSQLPSDVVLQVGLVAALSPKANTADVNAALATKANSSDVVAGLSAAILLTEKGAASGVATLGADSKIPLAQLPALAITEVFVANSLAMMNLLNVQSGDVCIRTDENRSYIYTGTTWERLRAPEAPPPAWGAIIGTITDQADLVAQLNLKLNVNAEATVNEIWAGNAGQKYTSPNQLRLAGIPAAIAYSANIALNGNQGLNFEIGVLTGNLLLANPSNMPAGRSGTIRLQQDNVGGRTISFGTNWRLPGGAALNALTPTANAVDILAYTVSNAGLINATLAKDFKA